MVYLDSPCCNRPVQTFTELLCEARRQPQYAVWELFSQQTISLWTQELIKTLVSSFSYDVFASKLQTKSFNLDLFLILFASRVCRPRSTNFVIYSHYLRF